MIRLRFESAAYCNYRGSFSKLIQGVSDLLEKTISAGLSKIRVTAIIFQIIYANFETSKRRSMILASNMNYKCKVAFQIWSTDKKIIDLRLFTFQKAKQSVTKAGLLKQRVPE